jgi:hypothetical protein
MKVAFILTILLFSNVVLADGRVSGKIQGYVINTDTVFVIVDGAIVDKPECNTTDRFKFNTNDAFANHFLSVILAAKASNELVILTGNGECSGGNSENLRKICTEDIPC